MNVALFLDGDCYNKDAIFDDSPDNWLNQDMLLHVWLNMKRYLNDRGVQVHTYDLYQGLDEIDKAIFFGLYGPNPEYLKRLKALGTDCYYVAYEPPVIHHFNTCENLQRIAPYFKKVLTHQDDLIDNRKFFRLCEGKVLPDMSRYKSIPFSERYLMLMMNSYRYANFDEYRELYSERFRAAKFFEKASDQFHVYGRGINNPEMIKARWSYKTPIFFHSYVGEIENKVEVMCRYKFNLCFENCTGVYGYVSEKIIHSFLAGVVPVYWGPVNPTDYFPPETFIDVRWFRDYQELYQYLSHIEEGAFNEYLVAIDEYLKSDGYNRFFGKEVFGCTIYQMLAEDREPGSDSVPIVQRERLLAYPAAVEPRISVLIPTRNRSHLLTKSLNCLLEQNYENLEIVVVDDCSEDDTASVVKQFMGGRRNIIYSKNETRIGAANNFLKAASLATGDFLLNFSDDDLLEKNAVHDFLKPLQQSPLDLIYSDLKVIDEEDQTIDVWRYEDYPEYVQLIRRLMDAGGNVIPEVLMIKRQLYDRLYGEMYAKRFITPFYLLELPKLKIGHIGKPLYHYRVHKKSTFHDRSGLIVRNLGVLNFLNLIMFQYPVQDIFQIREGWSQSEQLVVGILELIRRLLVHGKRFYEGTFYTGLSFTPKDRLWEIFYEYANHWLSLARRYGVLKDHLARMNGEINDLFSEERYNPVEVNELPDFYHFLPWFAHRPFSPVTRFIPLDMLTIGHHPVLDQEHYLLYQDDHRDLRAINRVVSNTDEITSCLERDSIQVINVFNGDLLNEVLNYLTCKRRFFTCIVNATGKPFPKNTPFQFTLTMNPASLKNLEDYLKWLRLSVK